MDASYTAPPAQGNTNPQATLKVVDGSKNPKPPAKAGARGRTDAQSRTEGRLFTAMRAIYDQAASDKLSEHEVAILHFVAFKDGNGNGCFASVNTICANTGIRTRHTVIAAVKSLEDRGLLDVSKSAGRSSTMRLKLDAFGHAENDTSAENNLCGKPHTPPVRKTAHRSAENHTPPVRKTAHEHSHQRTHERGSVEPQRSCVNAGDRLVAIHDDGRLGAIVVEDYERDARPRARFEELPVIEVPTEETAASLAEIPWVGAYHKWIAKEPPALGPPLVAFVRFLRHSCQKKRVTPGWLSKQWANGDWTLAPEDDWVVRDRQIELRMNGAPGAA